MCGITGIVGNPPAGDLEIRKMTELLRHRGPDDRGILITDAAHIGHTRLAILDPTPAGHQPMESNHIVLTYNGEIYNFRQLAKNLSGPLRSSSDTEVLLHLVEKYGERCLGSLIGMFAFAAWDRRLRRLFAARDRLGIKPFFYRVIPGGLAFASEIKSLLVLGRPPIRKEAISDYLSYRYIPCPETIYEGIFKLPPAHYLLWEDGRLEIHRYWSPPERADIIDPIEALEGLDEVFARVIPEHQLADVPVGVFLSGGLDSATIASYLERPRTFTLGSRIHRRDERGAAEAVARHIGARHHEKVAESEGLMDALDILPDLFDEPFSDSGAWAGFLIARLAREDVHVALSGEGGDELFFGYKRHTAWREDSASGMAAFLSHLVPSLTAAGRSLQRRGQSGFDNYGELACGFTRRQKEVLLPPGLGERDDYWFFKNHWREDLEAYQRLRWLDLHTYLPENLLVKLDRVSMAHSLEARPPFLDHRLVEYAMKLSPALFVDGRDSRGKLLFRRLVRDRLPEGHLEKRKRGFNLPIRSWLRKNPSLLSDSLDRLAEGGYIRRPKIFNVGNEQCLSILLLDRWLNGRHWARPAIG